LIMISCLIILLYVTTMTMIIHPYNLSCLFHLQAVVITDTISTNIE